MEFETYLEFCAYRRIFGFREGLTGWTISKSKSVYN